MIFMHSSSIGSMELVDRPLLCAESDVEHIAQGLLDRASRFPTGSAAVLSMSARVCSMRVERLPAGRASLRVATRSG